jgi:FkbM family methyltransferase
LPTTTRRLINSWAGQLAKPIMTRMFGRLGFELIPVGRDDRRYLTSLLQRLSIRTVFDIGANQGQFGLLLRRYGFAGTILSVEPMNAAFRQLERQARTDIQWSVCNVAVAEKSGDVTLNVARNSTSSSLLTINRLHVDAEPTSQTLRTEVVQSKTLDEISSEFGMASPYFLKIDVQGAEMAVLDGGSDTLRQTVALRIESSLRKLYEGAPTIGAILYRLDQEGFTPVGIETAFEDPRTGDTLQVDIVACRKELL